MAKFQCVGTPDLVVSTEVGFISFKDYSYTTTNKEEIALLKNVKAVKEVGAKPAPKEQAKPTLDV